MDNHKRITLTVRPGSDEAKRAAVIHDWHKSLLHEVVPGLIAKWSRVLKVSVADYYLQRIWTPKEIQLVLGGLKEDSVRFQGDGVEWLLSYNRMMIASAIADCGALATEILRKLPHTPVAATGTNFIFQDPEMTAEHPIFARSRALFPNVCSAPDLFKWSVVMHEEGARVEVTSISGEQGASFSVNRHRKAESSNAALVAVSRFAADKEYATNLVQRFLVGAQR